MPKKLKKNDKILVNDKNLWLTLDQQTLGYYENIIDNIMNKAVELSKDYFDKDGYKIEASCICGKLEVTVKIEKK